MHFKLYVPLALLTILLAVGCSGSGMDNTASPMMPPPALGERNPASQRALWGFWEISFEGESLTPRIEPMRAAELHYNITPMVTPPQCFDCISIVVNSFDTVTRIMDVDVTLKNPASVSGHDVRGILFTSDAGHELRNADDWTGLWDIAGGDEINPFKAFAKTNPGRVFAGFQQHLEKYLVYIPKPPQYAAIRYAVDVSWPGNCWEPYSIENFNQEEITSDAGSHGLVTVDVHDWQGDTDEVNIYAPLITGEPFTALAHQGGDIWSVDLNNTLGAPPGDYDAKIEAGSANSGETKLYDFVTITITPFGSSGWARTWGGTEYDYCNGVTTDSEGSVYAGGRFMGTDVNFDPGGLDLHSSNGENDIFLSKFDASGDFQWALTWGGINNDYCNSIAADGLDNIYVTGCFDGADVNFNPAGSDLHSSNGSADIFLCKFDSSGGFQWARTWGGDNYDEGYGVAAVVTGGIYVTGWYWGTDINFDPGGTDLHSSNGQWDVFVSKFDSSGDFQWARTWGGAGVDTGWDVCATGVFGAVYVTGDFNGENVNLNPDGSDLHSAVGLSDIFVSKFNSSGNFQWARTWGGVALDAGYGVAADGSGNVYSTGGFAGENVNFNPAGTNLHSSNGGSDIYVSKFNSSGVFQWARTWGATGNDAGYGVADDISGDICISGSFLGTNVNFYPGGWEPHTSNGGADVFLSRFNSIGNFQWARTWGGPAQDVGWAVAVDNSGNACVAGIFRGLDVDFSPDGVDLHSSNGGSDMFLSKYLPDGNW